MKHKALLDRVVALRPDILAAVVISDGRIVEQVAKDSSKTPPEQELPRMLIQSQLVVGIASTNEKVAGKSRFVVLCHEHLSAMLVPLDGKKVLIVPFTKLADIEGLGKKVPRLAGKN